MKAEISSTLSEKVFVGLVIVLVALCALFQGCNAVQGIGKDLQAISAPYVESAE